MKYLTKTSSDHLRALRDAVSLFCNVSLLSSLVLCHLLIFLTYLVAILFVIFLYQHKLFPSFFFSFFLEQS